MPNSILNVVIAFLLALLLHNHPSYCQQDYALIDSTGCTSTSSTSKGYLCNGDPKCESFVTFRATPPYDSAINISYLLGSDSSNVVLLNRLSSPSEKIPTNRSVIVPVSCNCAGSIYQHNTPYTVLPNDSYYMLSRIIFQGLTTCEAVKTQNYYQPEEIPVGAVLQVPVRCACPTVNQASQGILSLLTYVVAEGETLTQIGSSFGVTVKGIMEANKITGNSMIYHDFPILVPLSSQSCNAYPDMFYCYCSSGYLLDPTSGKFKCVDTGKKFSTKVVIIIGLSIGFGFLCLSLVSFQSYKCLKERKLRIHKEKLFKQNGGLLLQQKCSFYGSNECSKVYSVEELQRATNNFSKSRFLGQGGFGAVYKGMLPDGAIVAVKKSKAINKDRVEQFINEIVILSQINHRNIVKLLGCCLETEAPLLVYEYVSNGTLSYHIHNRDPKCFLSWEDRFRIACEVADAIAYMHSAASTPVFHRDIKPSNILLDEKYTSKVSDFGTSRSVPHDKTHLTTAVQGTFGYLDPEYFQSSQFTDKSDVYSFGVVLVELLTSEKPISFSEDDDEEGVNSVAKFISLTKSNSLLRIIDDRVAKEAGEEELLAIAMIARRCLRLNSKKRPTMKEVAMELEGLRRSNRCLQSQPSRALGDHDNKRRLGHSNAGNSQEMVEIMPFFIEMESTSLPYP